MEFAARVVHRPLTTRRQQTSILFTVHSIGSASLIDAQCVVVVEIICDEDVIGGELRAEMKMDRTFND